MTAPAPSGDGLDPEAVAGRLDDARHDVESRLAAMQRDLGSVFEASTDSNADDEHDPEGQTIAYERSQLAALITSAEEHLAGIDAARRRLDNGTYGICEVCGEPIPAARLDVRPTARTCVQHAG
ncbi:MAG: TraR/DksA family transcriptional regulator [Candidatus Nanopelagicales bacterium]